MSVEKINKTLQGLPLDDRIGALIIALCSCNVDSAIAIQRLVATAGILGSNLPSESDRRCCSTILRQCATEIEGEYRPISQPLER
jgi:hypothetical protein